MTNSILGKHKNTPKSIISFKKGLQTLLKQYFVQQQFQHILCNNLSSE